MAGNTTVIGSGAIAAKFQKNFNKQVKQLDVEADIVYYKTKIMWLERAVLYCAGSAQTVLQREIDSIKAAYVKFLTDN